MTFHTPSSTLAIFPVMIVLTLFSACTAFYGIKQPKPLSGQAILETAEKYRIPHGQIFVLDTAYKTFIRKISGQNKTLAKNHLQPLQLLYFNKSGELISYFINCNAGGFPNLKWNRNGMLDSFPPASQTTPDALFSFHDLLKFIKTPDGKKPNPKEFSHATYKTVVFWSVFMGRQSKRLIHQAEENYKLTNDKSAKLIFVNTDDLFTETN